MFSAWIELQDVFKKLPVLTAQYQVSPGKTPLITWQNYQLIAFIFSFTNEATPTTNIWAKLFFLPIKNELFDFKTTY